MHYTQSYDVQLQKVAHFQRYPELIPFIGADYGTMHSKLLIIAESHYLPAESSIHLDPASWYAGTSLNLTDKERKWINTRAILNKDRGQWVKKGHTIYRRLEEALTDSGYSHSNSAFRHVAFMNAFQRPAVHKDSIRMDAVDVLHSTKTINMVLELIAPDHVVFVSAKAKSAIGRTMSRASSVVPHPASAWWYRASKRGSGKDQFITLVSSMR